MSSDALIRARKEALKEVSRMTGDYLDADTLIANRLVFDIIDVVFDQGGGYGGSDRWLVKVEPHYETEEDPSGILTMSAGSTDQNGTYKENLARKRFMQVIQHELNELEEKGGEVYVGPAVLVKLKGTKYRFNEIVPWDEDADQPILPDGAKLAGASANEDMRIRRPRSEPPPPSMEHDPDELRSSGTRPSFAGAGAAKAEPASALAKPAPSATDISTPTATARTDIPARPAQTESSRTDKPLRHEASRLISDAPARSASHQPDNEPFPPLNEWAKSHGYSGKGRITNALKQQYEEARAYQEERSNPTTASAGTHSSSTSRASAQPEASQASDDVESQWRRQRVEAAQTRPADVAVGAPNRAVAPPPGGAQTAREQVFRPGMIGKTINACPDCGQHITDRIFPNPETGGFSLIHYGCTAGAPQRSMDAVAVQPES